jgi:RNA polymerase sigma-70 factor (ECF subfamily)
MYAKNQNELLSEVMKYQSLIESYAYGLLKDWSLSRDAFQETLLKASSSWEKLEIDRLPAWLKRVTHNHAVDIIRKRSRHTQTEDQLLDLIGQGFNTLFEEESRRQQKKRLSSLESCMKKLPPSYLKLILSYYRDRSKCDAIALKMNRTVNAVRLLLVRVRDKLKKCIEKKMAADS